MVEHLLLTARERAIRLRLVYDDVVVEVAQLQRDVVDLLVDASHVTVLDVLRFIRHLMVVRVSTSGKEHDRNTISRVVRVIAAAIDVLRMAVRVHRVIELERHLLRRVHLLHDIAELSR